MHQIHGPITDKLLKIFKSSDKAWTYRRPSREESKPMPRDGSVQGIKLSSGRRKRK